MKTQPVRSIHSRLAGLLMVSLSATLLVACGGDMSDLEQYIEATKSREGRRPEPLPEPIVYEAFTYVADTEGFRSPFEPDRPSAASAGGGSSVKPETNRSREYLEEFPLDSFDMVGTLSMGGSNYGLLRGQDGLVHRVLPGNYVGQNEGKITSISESEIQLVEIVSNGIGGYIEREVAIALAN